MTMVVSGLPLTSVPEIWKVDNVMGTVLEFGNESCSVVGVGVSNFIAGTGRRSLTIGAGVAAAFEVSGVESSVATVNRTESARRMVGLLIPERSTAGGR